MLQQISWLASLATLVTSVTSLQYEVMAQDMLDVALGAMCVLGVRFCTVGRGAMHIPSLQKCKPTRTLLNLE